MNANDARIVRLFTAQVDGTVEDNTPNANVERPRPVRPDPAGRGGRRPRRQRRQLHPDLRRHQRRHGDPAGLPEPPGNPFKEEWNLAGGWIRSGNDFVKTGEDGYALASPSGEADGIMRYRIAIPPGLTGAFHYNVRMVSENFQVTSFAQSNPFLLV